MNWEEKGKAKVSMMNCKKICLLVSIFSFGDNWTRGGD